MMIPKVHFGSVYEIAYIDIPGQDISGPDPRQNAADFANTNMKNMGLGQIVAKDPIDSKLTSAIRSTNARFRLQHLGPLKFIKAEPGGMLTKTGLGSDIGVWLIELFRPETNKPASKEINQSFERALRKEGIPFKRLA